MGFYLVGSHTPNRLIDRQDTVIRLFDICSVNKLVSYSGQMNREMRKKKCVVIDCEPDTSIYACAIVV